MRTKVDAVVVGAGHNGLVAANLLADAGWDVLVCEAAGEPGGAVRSAGVTAPGFVTDLGSGFYPMAAASPVLAGLDLAAHGLVWRHAPLVLAHVLPGGRAVSISRDPAATAASLEAASPGDGAAWLAAYRHWQRLRGDVLAALFAPFPPVRAGARMLRRHGLPELLRLVRFGLLPVRRYGAEEFPGHAAAALLAGLTLHTDLGPDQAGGAVFGWLLAMLGQQVGFPAPQGGAGRLTAALVARLDRAGGQVRCGAPVRQVVVSGGAAVGVRLAGGELLTARRAVLADVTAPVLYGTMLPPSVLPARLRADLRRFEWDHATVKVNWALSGPVPWLAAPARLAGTVHLAGDMAQMGEYAAALAGGRMPQRPYLVVGQTTTTDPARSPAGTESLWAYTHLPRRRGPWPAAAVREQADRIAAAIEEAAPGFGALVLARHVQGPADLAALDANLDQGAINGGSAQPHQQLVFRPLPGLGRADTPVDRLYLAGASAHPGGGVHGGPGANAARAALARAGRAGPLYAAGIRAAHRLVHGPARWAPPA
jgi:phytoene dehydrogenase-like protein